MVITEGSCGSDDDALVAVASAAAGLVATQVAGLSVLVGGGVVVVDGDGDEDCEGAVLVLVDGTVVPVDGLLPVPWPPWISSMMP